MNPVDPLNRFAPATRRWFEGTFATPTSAQALAWEAIADGDHTLVIAPTGSGKTLAAFLWAIDRLAHQPSETKGTRVLYISPLKALAIDVERNLKTPLAGIARIAAQDGLPAPQISVGVRSGDTPPPQRRQLRQGGRPLLGGPLAPAPAGVHGGVGGGWVDVGGCAGGGGSPEH